WLGRIENPRPHVGAFALRYLMDTPPALLTIPSRRVGARSPLLFGIKTGTDDPRCSVDVDCLHVAPLLGRLSLPRFREHVIDPACPLGLNHLQKLIVKRLAVGIFFTMRIGSLSFRKSGVE